MTAFEARRVEHMKAFGCMACRVLNVRNCEYLELHHLLSGGKRMGHRFSLFLCVGHHQGQWSARQLELLDKSQLVSIASGRKAFAHVYGTEWELWQRIQQQLKLDTTLPASKITPRATSGAAVKGESI
jgi:hypothetical protein